MLVCTRVTVHPRETVREHAAGGDLLGDLLGDLTDRGPPIAA
jgi:hypothetical protein